MGNTFLEGGHQQSNPANQPAFLDDLRNLDGVYGPTVTNCDTLVSNDSGFKHIAPNMIPLPPQERSGIGLFIGGGGALSLLPDLPVEVLVHVDKNSFVGGMSMLLGESILSADSPKETLEIIESQIGRENLVVNGGYTTS